MKKFIAFGIVAFFLVTIGQSELLAQKFGYVNSAAILAEMPEVKQADAQLATLRKQLRKKGQEKVEALKAKYQELARKEKSGEIAPKTLQEKAEKLKAEELKLSQYEQDMQQKIMEKRQALLDPILEKVQNAIDQVAETGGYTYIFDSSTGILLYADDAANITDEVKAKLGMQ